MSEPGEGNRAGSAGDSRGAASGGGDTSGPRGLRVLTAERFSFAEAIGGVRGLVESTVPGLVFVVVYVATGSLGPPLIAAGAMALLAVAIRLVQGAPVRQALSGLLGVVVGMLWARYTGRAQDYFVGGLLANAGWLVATVVSVIARWPLVGVGMSLVRGESMVWRTDPALAHERRRYVWATWTFAATFALRLAVQIPLYLTGQVAALGTAKLVMGIPLFAAALWVTWLLVGSPAARAEHRDLHQHQPR
jgi:hypothetical protein